MIKFFILIPLILVHQICSAETDCEKSKSWKEGYGNFIHGDFVSLYDLRTPDLEQDLSDRILIGSVQQCLKGPNRKYKSDNRTVEECHSHLELTEGEISRWEELTKSEEFAQSIQRGRSHYLFDYNDYLIRNSSNMSLNKPVLADVYSLAVFLKSLNIPLEEIKIADNSSAFSSIRGFALTSLMLDSDHKYYYAMSTDDSEGNQIVCNFSSHFPGDLHGGKYKYVNRVLRFPFDDSCTELFKKFDVVWDPLMSSKHRLVSLNRDNVQNVRNELACNPN